MKKIVLYAVLLGATLLVPVQGTDVGKLIPVELLWIYKEDDAVVIDTDLGESGTGATVASAIENLKSTTAGIIFLDTADYLLVDDGARVEGAALGNYLKSSVRVCISEGEIDVKRAAKLLSAHKPETKLRDYDSNGKYDVLKIENGKMILKEN